MDQLPALGRAIWGQLTPTQEIYTPLLLAKESEIRSTKCEEHSYGPHERQKLDVYYPSLAVPRKSQPLLIFVHGGGFVVNSKRNPEVANGLTNANLGHYFSARHGFTVVVPNYRRYDHDARYPSGGEDVDLVMQWIAKELSQRAGHATTDVFLVGNSAGGVHTATYALDPAFARSRASFAGAEPGGPRLRGIVLLSMPAHFKVVLPPMKPALNAYYGPDYYAHSPIGLVEAAKARGDPSPLPAGVGVLLLTAELDPEDILASNREFLEAWPWKDSSLQTEVIQGHNHISPPFALATGVEKEEHWGVRLAHWCEARAE